MDLHGQIMNLPQTPPADISRSVVSAAWNGYQIGHRDARHAAAELALSGDACADALRLFIGAGLGNSTDFSEQAKAYQAGIDALARLRG